MQETQVPLALMLKPGLHKPQTELEAQFLHSLIAQKMQLPSGAVLKLAAQLLQTPGDEQVRQLGTEHPTHDPMPSTIDRLKPDWHVWQELAKLQVVQLG